jgi:hypothetical protein
MEEKKELIERTDGGWTEDLIELFEEIHNNKK